MEMTAKNEFLLIRDSINKVAANLPSDFKSDTLPLLEVLERNNIVMPATAAAIETFIQNCHAVVRSANKTTEALPAPITVALESGPVINGSRMTTVYFLRFSRKE